MERRSFIQMIPEALPGTFPIRNRGEYFDLWERDAIGNHLRIWKTVAEIPEGIVSVMVREVNPNGGGGLVNVMKVASVRKMRFSKRVVYNELAPDDLATMQAYIRKENGIIYLEAKLTARAKLPTRPERMRQAIRRAKHYEGLQALHIVRNRVSPRDYEDIVEMLDAYPGHVLEFTAYACPVGWARHSNVIFWELRNYLALIGALLWLGNLGGTFGIT